ncbi:MAG: ribosomal protein S18-alanine N-acetyltransferase [Dehalococcoidales bacterium]|nr:ribosomal protein S18-alanine N-acetyltransferase [Dehalococcoidales bacterium]
MPHVIHPMRKEDIPQVSEIDREAFPNQWPPPNYKNELQNQIARYIVACEEGAAVAPERAKDASCIIYRLLPWLKSYPSSPAPQPEPYIVGFAGIWVLADEAHVTNIAVRKSCQRRGVGELLLIYLIDLAQKLKNTNLTLEVRASNTAAQSLYRKYGFIEMGVRRAYYLDNREDAVIMSTENIHTDSYQAFYRQMKEAYALRWDNQLPVS